MLAPRSFKRFAGALDPHLQQHSLQEEEHALPLSDTEIDQHLALDSAPVDDQPDYIYKCTNSRKGLKKYLQSKLASEKFEKWSKNFMNFGNFIAVVLASMLSVLVPQECGDPDVASVSCTFFQNIDWDCWYDKPVLGQNFCLSNFNKFVLVWNGFLALCFGVLFWLESKRESWLSKHLDMERTQLTDNLVHTRFWSLRGQECKVLSQRLFYAYLVTLIVFVFNVIVSGLLVLSSKNDRVEKVVRWNDGYGGYYLDFKTITVFYSNVSLLFLKLVSGSYYLFCICLEKSTTLHVFGWEIAKLHPLPWGLSTVIFEPSSYNAVAPEICLQELGAKGDMVGSWRPRRPNGKICPHVPRIAPEQICNCTETMTAEINNSPTGLLNMIVQGRVS